MIEFSGDRIVDFFRRTALTWEQVSRLFGVSTRTVMLWSRGEPMGAAAKARLADLEARLEIHPIDMRRWLMRIDEQGTAPFERWVEEVRERPRTPWIDQQPTPPPPDYCGDAHVYPSAEKHAHREAEACACGPEVMRDDGESGVLFWHRRMVAG